MRYLTITVLFIFSFLKPQEHELVGRYVMEYEKNYSSQNCVVNFEGSFYTRKLINGKSIKGRIDYQQYFIFLNDNKSNLQVFFSKRNIEKDTIYFRTKNLNYTEEEQELTVYAGKLIKLN